MVGSVNCAVSKDPDWFPDDAWQLPLHLLASQCPNFNKHLCITANTAVEGNQSESWELSLIWDLIWRDSKRTSACVLGIFLVRLARKGKKRVSHEMLIDILEGKVEIFVHLHPCTLLHFPKFCYLFPCQILC